MPLQRNQVLLVLLVFSFACFVLLIFPWYKVLVLPCFRHWGALWMSLYSLENPTRQKNLCSISRLDPHHIPIRTIVMLYSYTPIIFPIIFPIIPHPHDIPIKFPIIFPLYLMLSQSMCSQSAFLHPLSPLSPEPPRIIGHQEKLPLQDPQHWRFPNGWGYSKSSI